VLPIPGPDFVAQHLEMVPPPPSARAPWLGPPFDALLASLLAKDPAARPESASAVLEALGTLPWARADQDAVLSPAPPSAVRSEPPPPETARYRTIEERADGGIVALDELLGRRVLLWPCDAASAARWKKAGAIRSPFVQAVWSVSEAAGRAVLELPQGEAPAAPLGSEILAQLGGGLAAVHAALGAHGAVDADHVRLAAGRAVLLLPLRPAAGDPESDLRALGALGA